MIPTVCVVGETTDSTTINTSPAALSSAIRNKLEHLIWDRLSLVAAILSGTFQQHDCHLTSPKSSVHHVGPAHNQHTTPQCNDSFTSAAEDSLIPTNQL